MARPVMVLALALAACNDGSIQDGPSGRCPALVVATDAVTLGDARIGERNQATVTLTNDCSGNGNLTVSGSFADGSSAALLVEGSTTIAPGGSADLTVVFIPADYTAASGTLLVTSNDEDNLEVAIDVVATVDPDQDGDGHDASAAGGGDCDDSDPAVNPDADDAPYDGVDSNCDGADDYDLDGDGFQGGDDGDDCDDTRADVYPGATETDDLIDQDCDGLVDEDFVRRGDVLIREVMADPLNAVDIAGEWIEIYNPRDRAIDLQGWVIGNRDGVGPTVEGSLVIEARSRLVLGVSDDREANGGVDVHYVYPRSELALRDDNFGLSLVMGVTVIDAVVIGAGHGLVPGASVGLDPTVVDASDASGWCAQVRPMPSGDTGTPGARNDLCPQVDHDGDGYSLVDGDCDDTDPDVSPDGGDTWDGLDNDCALGIDRGTTATLRTADFAGAGFSGVGAGGFSVGDLDDDGLPELIVGTPAAGTNRGEVYVLDPAALASASGDLADYASTSVTGSSTYNQLGAIGPRQADITGDGIDDLVVGANGYHTSSFGSDLALAIFAGGSLGTSLDDEDAVATVRRTVGGFASIVSQQVVSHVDLTGDGLADVAYSQPNSSLFGTTPRYSFGEVYVFDGADLTGEVGAGAALWTVWGASQARLGSAMSLGDVDGDGTPDVVLGSYGTESSAGTVYLIPGAGIVDGSTPNVLADSWTARIVGTRANDQLGIGDITIADLDGDGLSDLVITGGGTGSAYFFSDAGALEGTVEIRSDEDGELSSTNAAGALRRSVADLDGDGADDLVVASPDSATTGGLYLADRGGLLGVYAAGTTFAASLDDADLDWAIYDAVPADGFGLTMLAADLDGDGDVDLAAGAPGAGSRAGRVDVFILD